MSFLWGDCPIPQAEVKAVEPVQTCCSEADAAGLDLAGLPDAAKRVLGHYHCCDQSQAGFQFDSTVQGRTVVGPYGGKTGKMPTNVFVAAPLRGKPYGVVSTIAYNPFYGDVDSAGLVRLLVVEAITRAVVAGADPRAIALNDNFYTPRYTPEVGWHLKRMVEAAASVSKEFGTPFISGKDSSSGTFLTTDGRSIDVPNVCCGDRRQDGRRFAVEDQGLQIGRELIVLVGGIDPTKLGGSVYLDCFGKRGSKLGMA